MKVGIIGAGPAGVTAAQVIAKEGVNVTLFSAEKVPPYHRPRLPEIAFGQEQQESIFMHKLEWYADNGIDLRLDSRVKAFTRDFEILLEDNSREKFDALVLAIGAVPIVPDTFRENPSKNIFSLWNYSDALNIKERIKSSNHMAIAGGGLIGIESALRDKYQDLNITLIEKKPYLMSRYFGKKASEMIEAQLHSRNIIIMLDNNVCRIEDAYNNKIEITLKNEDGFLCDFILLAVGAEFDVSMAAEAGLETGTQIIVNENLQTSSPGIFAAGDIAQLSMLRPCSAKEASQQGKIVGYNVLAHLNDKELQVYEAKPTPIHMKYKDFEIYSLGEVPTIGDKENVLDCDAMKVYRGCVYENSALAGVQMVSSNEDFEKYHKEFLLSKIWKKLKQH